MSDSLLGPSVYTAAHDRAPDLTWGSAGSAVMAALGVTVFWARGNPWGDGRINVHNPLAHAIFEAVAMPIRAEIETLAAPPAAS